MMAARVSHAKPTPSFSVDASVRIARVRYVLPRHKAANWVGPGRGRKSTRPGANGVVELTPFEFLNRLADLVPPPRKHRHRYHGVFAPNHKLRRAVTALAIGNVTTRQEAATGGHGGDGHGTGGCCAANPSHKPRSLDTSRIAWAKLMARVGEEFPLECPRRGDDIRLIAFITEPGPIRKILTHLGEPLEPPPVSPARGPPIDWGELVQVHDDRAIFQASPDELAVIDIHSLEPAWDTRRRSHGNVRLERGLRRREKNAIAEGKPRVSGTLFWGQEEPATCSRAAHELGTRCGSAINRAILFSRPHTPRSPLLMIVTLKAVIHDGKVELAEPATLPEGAKVLVTVLPDDGTDFWTDASQKSLAEIWGNPEDDEYAKLLQK